MVRVVKPGAVLFTEHGFAAAGWEIESDDPNSTPTREESLRAVLIYINQELRAAMGVPPGAPLLTPVKVDYNVVREADQLLAKIMQRSAP
jgi:hypothetical protein